jgi:hypothetical protein
MKQQRESMQRPLDSYALHNQPQYAGLIGVAKAGEASGAGKVVVGALGAILVGGVCATSFIASERDTRNPARALCVVPLLTVGTVVNLTFPIMYFKGTSLPRTRKRWLDRSTASLDEVQGDLLSVRTAVSYSSMSLDGFHTQGLGAEAILRMTWAMIGLHAGVRWSGDARTQDDSGYKAIPFSLMLGVQPFTGSLLSPYAGVSLTANADFGPVLTRTEDYDFAQWMIGNVSYFRWLAQRGTRASFGGAFLRDLFVDIRLLFGGGGDLPNGVMFGVGVNTRIFSPQATDKLFGTGAATEAVVRR